MDRKDVEEELPDVFTFNVALTQSSTYYRWRHIGVTHKLPTDEDIAYFLMDHYDKVTGASSVHGVCATCHSPLRLSCVNCGVVKSESSAEGTAEGGEVSALGDSSVNKDEEMLQGRVNSKLSATLNVDQTDRTLRPSDGGELPQVLGIHRPQDHSGQTFKEEPPLELETEAQNAELAVQPHHARQGAGGQHGDSHPDLQRQKALPLPQQQRGGEVTKHRDEQTGFPPSPPPPSQQQQQHAGERRRRRRGKYPEVSLVCVVCGRKLSSRMSVLNHMTTQHPTADLPPPLAPLAARSSAKTPPSSRRGRRKKSAESGARVDRVSGSASAAEAEADSTKEDRDADADAEKSKPQPNSKRGRKKRSAQGDVRVEAASDSALAGDPAAGAGLEDRAADTERLKRRKAELESLMCETCGMTFEHKKQMYNHRRHCTWKVCHLCGKSVKLLEMHLKRHSSPGQFPCPRCPKTFRDRHHLNQHMLYHNGERPYCCEVCGMRYHERTRLNTHLRTHTGIKPFKCTQCDAAFTRMRGLSDHKRVHTGEKPYGCQVCGRQFSSSGNLAAHRRKVHRMEPLTPNHVTRKLYNQSSAVNVASAANVSLGFIPTT